MVLSQFSLSWDAYKSSICCGFSALQQNGEFVDMTLAADGHFVKVHQVLMAMVSPYLKELITSAPCQHPVIFLNNVSHRTLCLLLEYIYTGEVLVPSDNLSSLVETAKSLHIKGLENFSNQDDNSYKPVDNISQMEGLCHVSATKKLILPSNSEIEIEASTSPRQMMTKQDAPKHNSNRSHKAAKGSFTSKDNINEYTHLMDTTVQDSDDDFGTNDNEVLDAPTTTSLNQKDSSSTVQFSVSIRGSLQVILNRYIYNLHSTKHRSGMRRWRCVDYRNIKCTAFLITKGNVVVNRANPHNHPFHDKKIIQKIEKKAVFTAIDEIQDYKDKESKVDDTDTTMEQEEFAIDFNDAMGSDVKREWDSART